MTCVVTVRCDPVLTGQELVAKAWSTAAELHAFACTQKAAPEVHDAYTSTDPFCSLTGESGALVSIRL